jgi:spermidine synthase
MDTSRNTERNNITVWELSDPKNPDPYTGQLVAQGKTDKQEWIIIKNAEFQEMLFIDGQHQSSRSDEHLYHETLIHGLLSCLKAPKKVLILGGAEGCGIREVLKWPSIERVVQVDWDDELVQYFQTDGSYWNNGAYDDPRVEIVCEDVRRWLRNTTEKFDAIFVDLLDPTPNDTLFLMTVTRLCKDHLAPDGGFSINVGQVEHGTVSQACELSWFIKSIFNESYVERFASRIFVPSYGGNWCFFTCIQSPWKYNLENNEMPFGLKYFTKEKFLEGCEWSSEYRYEISRFGYD